MAYIGRKPAAAALTASDITDGIITNAKLAQDIISADTALGAEPADTDEFLVSDAGTLKRMDYSYIKSGGGGITQASQWRMTADRTNSGTGDDIDSNLEEVDTEFSRIGSVMSESSGVFTFPATGIWLVTFIGTGSQSSADDGDCYIKFTPDNSTYTTRVTQWVNPGDTADKYFIYCQGMFDITNTTNCKVKFGTGDTNSLAGTLYGDTNANETYFTFIRLGDT